MDENLVGYLLEALNADDRRKVEAYLHRSPDAQNRLALLRRALEPLALDDDTIDPPADLACRTLKRVADYRGSHLPHAPFTLSTQSGPPRTWWRRADVVVAAGILLCLFLLVPPGINKVRARYEIAACQNNLRLFHTALQNYSELHDGDFPNVAAAEPRNVAAIFIPILNQEKLLPDKISILCPALGVQPPPPWSFADIQKMGPEEFARYVPRIAGCYAYSLGYRDEQGNPRGLRLDPYLGTASYMPILADSPPASVEDLDAQSNSPNHGGVGQNVLYVDGHCAFVTMRTVGPENDDIFLNLDNKVAAGKTRLDTVLATGAAKP